MHMLFRLEVKLGEKKEYYGKEKRCGEVIEAVLGIRLTDHPLLELCEGFKIGGIGC